MPGNAAKQTVWGFVKQWELPAIHSASLVSTDWPECSVPRQFERSSRYCCPAFEKWSRCEPTERGEMMLNIIFCWSQLVYSQKCLSIGEGIKPRTERNRMEPEVIVVQCWCECWTRGWKFALIRTVHLCVRTLISRSVTAMKTGQVSAESHIKCIKLLR